MSACSRSWTSSTSQQPMGRHVTSSPCGSSRSSSRNQRSTSDPTNERESAEEAHIRREHQRRAQPHYNLRERQHTDDNDNQGCYNNPCPRRLSFDNAYLDGKKRKVDESHTEMKTDDLETELPTTVEMAAQGIEDQVDALLHSMESWHLTDLKAFREKRTGISSQVRDQRQVRHIKYCQNVLNKFSQFYLVRNEYRIE